MISAELMDKFLKSDLLIQRYQSLRHIEKFTNNFSEFNILRYLVI